MYGRFRSAAWEDECGLFSDNPTSVFVKSIKESLDNLDSIDSKENFINFLHSEPSINNLVDEEVVNTLKAHVAHLRWKETHKVLFKNKKPRFKKIQINESDCE